MSGSEAFNEIRDDYSFKRETLANFVDFFYKHSQVFQQI